MGRDPFGAVRAEGVVDVFGRPLPAQSTYAHRMWMRHQDALGRPGDRRSRRSRPREPRSAAPAAFALETSALAHRTEAPERAVDAAFDLLERGWSAG
ncbi:hypothetical protein [Embleya sp. NPDC050493]|uniref:hypothetical protein n=1 Tax=Embleya sp. NPDC050493 TaxID=3363989 RepID=UPI00379CA79E